MSVFLHHHSLTSTPCSQKYPRAEFPCVCLLRIFTPRARPRRSCFIHGSTDDTKEGMSHFSFSALILTVQTLLDPIWPSLQRSPAIVSIASLTCAHDKIIPSAACCCVFKDAEIVHKTKVTTSNRVNLLDLKIAI